MSDDTWDEDRSAGRRRGMFGITKTTAAALVLAALTLLTGPATGAEPTGADIQRHQEEELHPAEGQR